jgi:hypothetical protein
MLASLLLFVAVFQDFLGRLTSFWPLHLIGLLLCFGLILANSRLLPELLWKLFSEEKCPAPCTG